MNSRERFRAVMNFERGVMTLKAEYGYWVGTIRRFIMEGMPVVEKLPEDISVNGNIMGYEKIDPLSSEIPDRNVRSYLKLDSYISKLPFDMSPMLEEKIISEDIRFKVYTDRYGITKRVRKDGTSTPLDIDHPVKNRGDFERYKEYYDEEFEKRLPEGWDEMKKKLKLRDYPVRIGGFPYGYLGFPRHLMGQTDLFLAMYDDPKLVKDINGFFLKFVMNYWSRLFEDVEVDCCLIFEDMAYRSGSLISKEMFKEFLHPCYVELVDFLKQHHIKIIIVDSDGFIEELIPLWLETGITGVLPCEIQAGNDLLRIRERFPSIQLLGGINKMILSKERKKVEIDREISKVTLLLKQGGYVPHIDHHVSEDACWVNFKYYRERLNEIIDSFHPDYCQ